MFRRFTDGLNKAWAAYNRRVVTNPYITKGLTGGTLFGTGDYIGQHLDGSFKKDGYNPVRTLTCFFWSSCCFTPYGHRFYSFLAKRYPGRSIKNTLKKVIIDQSITSPLAISGFMTFGCFTQGLGLEGVKYKLEHLFPTVLKSNYMVWPLIQFVNFTFVPFHLQLSFQYCGVLFWSIYLAMKGAEIPEHFTSEAKISTDHLLTDITDASVSIAPLLNITSVPVTNPVTV